MKREYAKKIAVLLGTICAMNLSQVVSAGSFNDVSGHWSENAINKIKGFELINGFEGSFRPNEPITRGELAVILDRLMVYQNKEQNNYNDLDNNFYTDSILKLTKAGVMNGSDNKVRPKDNISREEAACMIARAFDISLSEGAITPFKDAAQISDWALKNVNALLQNGLISGDNGNFRPKDNITRAEVVTILSNILGGYYKNPGTFSQNTDQSVVVAGSDVKLEDTVIEKDLIISAGVGEGDVTLSNVTVKGRTLVYGGGSHSIHIEGNSSLGNIELAKDGEPIRIVSDDTSSIGTVLLRENNADTIIEGKVEKVEALSSDKQIEVRGEVNNLSLKGDNTTLNLTGKGKIDKLSIGQNRTNNNIIIEKSASINTIDTFSNIDIKGEGNISSINKMSDDLSISIPKTIKTEVTTPSQNTNSSSSSSSSSGSSSNSSSGNNSSNQNEKPKIINVESVQNGLVRFTLDKKFEGNLTKDMISIICTSGGSDMTVLGVKTSDNIVFDVTTAYYKDNTYSLAINFSDGTFIEKSFEVRALAPIISSIKVERESDNKANVLYVSDTTGKLYYILKENNNARELSNEQITESDVVKNGTVVSMKRGGNTVELTDLKKDTSYTMYYVAEDLGGNRTTLKQISITSKSDNPSSPINIVNAEGFYENKGFFGENYWFKFELSEEVPLELSNFTISCPTDGKLTLGRLETTDNKNYTVYMQKGYVPTSDNVYTVEITFPNGTTAKKGFFVDFSEPIITRVETKRLSETTAEVTFNSDEAGILYWKVLPLSDVPQDTSPKDPNLIIEGGTKQALYEGGNLIKLEDILQKDAVFCYVSQDQKGNTMEYYGYKTISNEITKPEEPNPENQLKFTIEEVGTTHYMIGEVTYININFSEGASLQNTGVTIRNKSTGQSFSGYRYFDTEGNKTIYYKQGVLPKGEYTLTIVDGDRTGSQDFTIE